LGGDKNNDEPGNRNKTINPLPGFSPPWPWWAPSVWAGTTPGWRNLET